MAASPCTIAVLLPRLNAGFDLDVLVGIRQVVSAHGIRIIAVGGMPCEIGPAKPAWDQIAGCIAVINIPNPEDSGIRELVQTGIPLVAIGALLPDLPCPVVLPDNRGGMYSAVRHLIDHGHERIGFVGVLKIADQRERYYGYTAALTECGIRLDPGLVANGDKWVTADGRWSPEGRRIATMSLIEARSTAIVYGNDLMAMIAMPIIEGAGYRIPEDIAIVGFDDLPEVQYTKPPLTTIRQSYAAQGRAAAELLLAQLAGQRVPLSAHYVPTALVPRRSCGCDTLPASAVLPNAAALLAADWQATLAHAMVALVQHPTPHDLTQAPTTIWPEVDTLIQAVDAALQNAPAPAFSRLERAWQQAAELTQNLELLHASIDMLELVAQLRRTHLVTNTATPARLNALLGHARLEVARALQKREMARNEVREAQIQLNHTISMALLEQPPGQAVQLAWLAQTNADWGCLGLWDHTTGDALPTLRLTSAYMRSGAALPLGQRYPATAFPPIDSFRTTAAREAGTIILLPLRSLERDWGVFAVCRPIESWAAQDTDDSALMWAMLLRAALERDALLGTLAEQQVALQATNQALSLAKSAADHARTVAETANHLKTRFLANMSHELRTPLNAILNFTRFLSKERYGTLSAAQQDLQARVLSNAEHLLGLINDILDLAKIESGRTDLVLEDTDLLPLLRGVMATAVGLTKDIGLDLTLDAPTTLPLVRIDKIRIRQVLLNLLSNAAKFSEQGGITLTAQPTAGGMVCIAVTDSGIGITPENQALIFEEFRQVDGVLNRQQQGSGLGLPISKRLVEMHGGSLWLASTPGEGSTFSFTVPISPSALPGEASE